MFKITQQTQADSQVVEALMTEAFGLNRYDRSVWALRPGEPLAALCLVGYDDDQAVGSLRFWEVMLNNETIVKVEKKQRKKVLKIMLHELGYVQ